MNLWVRRASAGGHRQNSKGDSVWTESPQFEYRILRRRRFTPSGDILRFIKTLSEYRRFF